MGAPLSDSQGATLVRIKAFSNTDDLKFRGTGISATATKTTTTNIEYKMPEDRFTNGLQMILKNHVMGDTVCFQVVDKDGIGVSLGWYDQPTFDAMGEYIADEFGTGWHVVEDKQDQGQIIISYPALIYKDLYIRLKYTSTGTTDDVTVCANLFLHKKP
jgi:hypothetical protein